MFTKKKKKRIMTGDWWKIMHDEESVHSNGETEKIEDMWCMGIGTKDVELYIPLTRKSMLNIKDAVDEYFNKEDKG